MDTDPSMAFIWPVLVVELGTTGVIDCVVVALDHIPSNLSISEPIVISRSLVIPHKYVWNPVFISSKVDKTVDIVVRGLPLKRVENRLSRWVLRPPCVCCR